MHHIFILISFQVLSGQHPWSEIKNDMAVMFQLSRGNKPKRPSSRPIEDQHWELIQRCWSSVGDRPCTEDVVSSLQQFLRSFPPPLPLLNMFRFLSHSSIPPPQSTAVSASIHTQEQNISTLEPVPQDGKCMAVHNCPWSHKFTPQVSRTLSSYMISTGMQVSERQVIIFITLSTQP